MKGGGKAARARARAYEKREAGWWADHGFTVDLAWNECRGFVRSGGRSIPIIKRRDFFGAFDINAVKGLRFAGVQVTESPFEASGKGGADRNAAHGEPPFAWVAPTVGVEEWASLGPGCPELVQVIVSYVDARHPDRRWWWQR